MQKHAMQTGRLELCANSPARRHWKVSYLDQKKAARTPASKALSSRWCQPSLNVGDSRPPRGLLLSRNSLEAILQGGGG